MFGVPTVILLRPEIWSKQYLMSQPEYYIVIFYMNSYTHMTLFSLIFI